MNGPALSDRSCGTCTLCCRLPEIDEFDKPANEWCSNCIPGKGCSIYAHRPSLCRDFMCRWMLEPDMDSLWNPAVSRMMVYQQGVQITILVDPAYPDIWKQEPYLRQLEHWAQEADRTGGYVIVYVGDTPTKIGSTMAET